MNFKILLRSSAAGRHVKKEGKKEIQVFEYIENKMSLLDEIKIIFHNF